MKPWEHLFETRESCLDCVRKHLAQAEVLMSEVPQGYPDHQWIAVGHMGEAADESIKDYPALAKEIRKHRIAYMANAAYVVPIMDLIKKASSLAESIEPCSHDFPEEALELDEADLPIRLSPEILTPAIIPAGDSVIPSPADLQDMLRGKGALIRVPEGVPQDSRITAAFTNLAKGKLQDPIAWGKLLSSVGTHAGVYLASMGGWYRVRAVIEDEGGGTGMLRVTGLGRAGRRGEMTLDIDHAVGKTIPTVWYRAKR
jgi:hypothetical protein